MVIQHVNKSLNELSKIEDQIKELESLIYNHDLCIDSAKLLENILKNYCRERY